MVCAELASRLNVSEHTIRRDLHELSREGYCKKVYGGAVMTLPEAGDYSARKEKNTATKSRIAQKCAKLVKPGAGANGGHQLPRDRCRIAQKTAV